MIRRNNLSKKHPIKPLGEVVDFLDNLRKPVTESERKPGPYPYYGANGIQGTIDKYIFDEPLVLLAEDGGHFWDVSRGIAYRISGKTWVNNHAHVLKPKKDIDLNYLCRVLENYDVAPFVTGTTRGKLTKGSATQIPIPVPPLDEQKRIAAILDKADALRTKRREAIEKVNSLSQSIFLEMFGDPATNPKNYKKCTLGDLIYSAKDGPHVSPEYVSSGVPFLSMRHVRKDGIVFDDLKYISREDAEIHWKKCKPSKGDILYTKGGTTGIAKAILFDKEFAIWVHVALLKPKHDLVSEIWLENMLNSDFCYRQSQLLTKGIANRDLGLKRMVNIEMFVPPKDEQMVFVNRLNSLSTLNYNFVRSEKSIGELSQSLQARYFGDVNE